MRFPSQELWFSCNGQVFASLHLDTVSMSRNDVRPNHELSGSRRCIELSCQVDHSRMSDGRRRILAEQGGIQSRDRGLVEFPANMPQAGSDPFPVPFLFFAGPFNDARSWADRWLARLCQPTQSTLILLLRPGLEDFFWEFANLQGPQISSAPTHYFLLFIIPFFRF